MRLDWLTLTSANPVLLPLNIKPVFSVQKCYFITVFHVSHV